MSILAGDGLMLTSHAIAAAIERIVQCLPKIRDQLNEADRFLGDGDTGMTVAQIVIAWHTVSVALPDDIGEALLLLGREARRATGSTLGGVLATGLTAAGKRAQGQAAVAGVDVASLLATAVEAIMSRSGATAGAKTIVDSLLRIETDLKTAGCSDTDALALAVSSAAAALDEYRPRQSQLGRARIYGIRSAARDDPGMLAVYLLLTAAQ